MLITFGKQFQAENFLFSLYVANIMIYEPSDFYFYFSIFKLVFSCILENQFEFY